MLRDSFCNAVRHANIVKKATMRCFHIKLPGSNRGDIFLYPPRCFLSLVCVQRRSASSTSNPEDVKMVKVSEDPIIPSKYPGFLESFFYGAKIFGRVKVQVPFDVQVEPLDPQTYPRMNKAFVKVFYTGVDVETLSPNSLSSLAKLYDLHVDLKEETELSVRGEYTTQSAIPLTCLLQVPVKFDVEIKCTGDGSISVKDMENEKIDIRSLGGDCRLHNIKSHTITVENQGGDIVSSKLLQGDMSLKTTGSGKMEGDLFQAQVVTCESQNGSVNIKSVYGEEVEFKCGSGSLTLGSCHGNTTVETSGDVIMGSLYGNLDAKVNKGSVDIYLDRHQKVDICCQEGNITLKLPATTDSSLNLQADHVSLDEQTASTMTEMHASEKHTVVTGKLNGGSGKITAITNRGNIRVQCQDWLKSLNLSFSRE